MRWSSKPRHAYVNDEGYGPGNHPAFQNNEGAWNIFWLTSSMVDNYVNGNSKDSGYSDFYIAIAVGMSIQGYTDNEETIGELALRVNPTEFMAALNTGTMKTCLLAPAAMKGWWHMAEKRATTYGMIPEHRGLRVIQGKAEATPTRCSPIVRPV
ncbi:MAG: hypothetical protein A2511_14605 [Deltaproteobacteria bacterium RIFOXYD12_FULL_50_9]|nr:MAG: hypothetical protein A2511_14605 [Deltaproteobacteria bacterium RIFOXYD12_FULL_50_9]